MARSRKAAPIDDYVLDMLMRDLVGHDQQPAAFLVYLHLHGRAARSGWQPVSASLRLIAEVTGFSKSAMKTAMETLHRRESVRATKIHVTVVPARCALRPWRR